MILLSFSPHHALILFLELQQCTADVLKGTTGTKVVGFNGCFMFIHGRHPVLRYPGPTQSIYIYTYILVAGSHGRTSHPVVTRCHLCLYTLPNFSWRSKRWDIVGPYWTDVELIQLYMWMDRWRGKFCSGIRGLDCRPWTLGSRECCTFQEQLRNWC